MASVNHTTIPPPSTLSPPAFNSYTLRPVPPLLPWLSDFHLSLLLPIAAYWLMSLIFHIITSQNLFPQYRVHTPQEFKKRNCVTVGEVLRSVILQQIIQTALGLLIGHLFDVGDFCGRETYDVLSWAVRIRKAAKQGIHAGRWVSAILGIDGAALGEKVSTYARSYDYSVVGSKSIVSLIEHMLSRVFENQAEMMNGGFTEWEIRAAKVFYWILEPISRFGVAVFFSDTWQYFWHRVMHTNRWMYRNLHARHHQIYVPYAFGAFYNTLSEAFIVDTIGTTLSLWLSGLTIRQTMCFSTISVMKGVDDHCGYRLPWDPLQWLNEQNTAFHDVHHQSWGIKSNYSQLYTTFWDHVCNTVCPKTTEEIERLYKKSQTEAETSGNR